MIRVLFVDDEVLAMDYLQNMISWEEHGFLVVGHARSGKKALEMYDREKPDIVISDIKMQGMDGLELAQRLKEKDPGVIVILLSAYKDFEYAQKGFEYGVSNYLLKHELCEEKLLYELEKVKKKLSENEQRKKIYYKYFTKQLIYNQAEDMELPELGNSFFLVMLHKEDRFVHGSFVEQGWTQEETAVLMRSLEETVEDIMFISSVLLNLNTFIVLYGIGDINSRYTISSRIGQMCRRIGNSLCDVEGCGFNLIHSDQIRKNEISRVFQKMSAQVRRSVFWKPCCIYPLSRLKESGEEEKISWNEQQEELRQMICNLEGGIPEFICGLFEMVRLPEYNLRALRELVYMLENLMRELENKEGIAYPEEEEATGSRIEDIQEYYKERAVRICREISEQEDQQYSGVVREIIRYIRQNFREELSLEILGEEFGMNGVYLGQVFKKETGVTFLKYLTNIRIEEAKRLLDDGKLNIAQVSDMVGYKTSQYFSQIFAKTAGVTPQEYRKWSKKR
ncbi:response regulator [Blautia schinkii]|nr:response regulator [Blautia schinkii]